MLIIGYGNPGRGDDGLGPMLAERLAAVPPPRVSVSVDFQLTVDHAPMVADHDLVVFVDAMVGAKGPFDFAPVRPAPRADLASHQLSPQAVLALSETLYERAPPAFVLGIAGRDFGQMQDGLSHDAARNLDAAETFLRQWLAGQSAA